MQQYTRRVPRNLLPSKSEVFEPYSLMKMKLSTLIKFDRYYPDEIADTWTKAKLDQEAIRTIGILLQRWNRFSLAKYDRMPDTLYAIYMTSCIEGNLPLLKAVCPSSINVLVNDPVVYNIVRKEHCHILEYLLTTWLNQYQYNPEAYMGFLSHVAAIIVENRSLACIRTILAVPNVVWQTSMVQTCLHEQVLTRGDPELAVLIFGPLHTYSCLEIGVMMSNLCVDTGLMEHVLKNTLERIYSYCRYIRDNPKLRQLCAEHNMRLTKK